MAALMEDNLKEDGSDKDSFDYKLLQAAILLSQKTFLKPETCLDLLESGWQYTEQLRESTVWKKGLT